MENINIVPLIQAVRNTTGASIQDCKLALETTDMDINKACELLRQNYFNLRNAKWVSG